MMDYKKFAAQVEKKISKTTTKRENLENKIAKAREEAAASEEKCNTIAQDDDIDAQDDNVDAYLAAKTNATQAAEKAEFYSMKLNNLSPYIFTIEQLFTVKNKLSNSYAEEQEELEKVIKDSLKALREQLLPLVLKFEEHRKTGNAALQKMTTVTDPGDNEKSEQARIESIRSQAMAGDIFYKEDINPNKILEFINDTLNDHQ